MLGRRLAAGADIFPGIRIITSARRPPWAQNAALSATKTGSTITAL
jgi:hypothetical protein